MPSKKRKYNARFPAGRIKKIMQTDEEVGKVAQAVPIIISRTLELFVESLLGKAMQVTMARNAKTLSPSHVKQCILAESRFDFLRDLVKNIPDVSAAEEKEMMSAESSPNASRFSEMPALPRRLAREDSTSSNNADPRGHHAPVTRESLRRAQSCDTDLRTPRTETITSTIVSGEGAMDLSKKSTETDPTPFRVGNFYQETLNLSDEVQVEHKSVIKPNPTYATSLPSTSNYATLRPVEQLQKAQIPLPKTPDASPVYPGLIPLNNNVAMPKTPTTLVAPILNIDFSKSLLMPEIKVLDSTVASAVGAKLPSVMHRLNSHRIVESKNAETKTYPPRPVAAVDLINSGYLQINEDYDTPEVKVLDPTGRPTQTMHRQYSKSHKNVESKRAETKPNPPPPLAVLDPLNSDNLQIDEDYDT